MKKTENEMTESDIGLRRDAIVKAMIAMPPANQATKPTKKLPTKPKRQGKKPVN